MSRTRSKSSGDTATGTENRYLVVVGVVVVVVDVDVTGACSTVPLVMNPRLSTTAQFLMSHEIADQVLVARLRAAVIAAQPPVRGETVSNALSAPSTATQKPAVGQATESSSWLLPDGTVVSRVVFVQPLVGPDGFAVAEARPVVESP
jgi:hypothetical protein